MQLIDQLKKLFPSFSQHQLVAKIAEEGHLLILDAGEQVLDVGSIIKIIPLVVSGSIKIVREDQDGNEIFLYYVRAGESCAMTLASCLRREKSTVKAVVENTACILTLPVASVYDFVHKYPSWNDFMAETYALRFDEILAVIDNIAFHKMDDRLLKYLIDKCQLLNTDTLVISKTDIAKDLNSSREVISRLMKQMEKNKMIKMSGNSVKLLVS